MATENKIHTELFNAEEMMEADNDTTIVFGNASAIPQFAMCVESLHTQTLLLCMGGYRSMHTSGAFKSIMDSVGLLDFNMPRFENIPPEPDVECVRKLVAAMEREKPDLVAAVGGGSVMDAAKAAYLSWQAGVDVTEFFGGKDNAEKKFPGKNFKRVICLPTTAGTGSEATPYANILETPGGLKRLIADRAIIPEYAFIDPMLTLKVPPSITRSTGLDAFTHACESLINWKAAEAHPENAERAVTAITFVKKYLPLILADSDAPHSLGRTMLSAAATLAGICIKDCPTSLPHMCSFSVTGLAKHGDAVAMFLPHFWRYSLSVEKVRERTMLLAGLFGASTPEGVVDAAEEFIRSVGGSTVPAEVTGKDSSFIKVLAADAQKNKLKLESAPRAVEPEKCLEVFTSILGPVWGGAGK